MDFDTETSVRSAQPILPRRTIKLEAVTGT